MAQIVTITNPLTGQPAQVDQLDHTAQEIDDAIARALPGGAIDITLQKKVDGLESTDYSGCYYRTVDGVVEWLNPPMLINTEYRTTERRNGLPVYTQFKNLGKIVNGAYGDISVTNLDAVVGYEAFWVNRPLPIIKNSSLTDAETQYLNVYVLNANTIRVYYYGGTSVSGNGDVYVLVKYTKNT